MGDKPVQPLTLYRLTLETDEEDAFNFFREFFKDKRERKDFLWDEIEVREYKKHIIGVEARIRERLIE